MEEFNKIKQNTGTFLLNMKKSPLDDRDFKAETIYPDQVELPKKLDLRPYLYPVVNQGVQGTCSAQVAACMKEYQEYKLQKLTGIEGDMSPQFVYNLREEPDYEGMTPRETMKILQQYGICREAIYPYNTIEYPMYISQDAYADALTFRIQNYAQINTIDALKKALVKDGVCYICFPVYNSGMQMWKAAQGDIDMGGHAMAVVGYDDDKEHFIIRNSWGEDWGDNGYTYYPYEDFGAHWEIWGSVDKESAWPEFDVSEYKQPIKASHLLWIGAAILLIYVYATK
jgi:C1A family cysteine protease